MAEKLNEETQVKRWHDRIASAKRHREQHANTTGWDTWLEEYKGNYSILAGSLGNVIVPPVNEIFSFVDADVSLISAKNPYLTVTARKDTTIQAAAILEGALNYYWRELKIKTQTDSELLDGDIIGHAWHKTGHTAQTEGTGEELKLVSERLYSNRVSWRDIVFNVGSRQPGVDSLWMAQRIVRPLSELKKEYTQLANLSGTIHPHIDESESKRVLFQDDIKVGILWEIWDAVEKKVYLVAENHKKYLKKIDWPDYLDEFPFTRLAFYEIPDEPWPISPVSIWEPLVIEKSKLLAMLLNHLKRWNRQLLIKEGAMTEAEENKYLLGVDGSVVHHLSSDIRRDAMFADYGQMSTDFHIMLDRLDQIKNNLSGLPEIERGGVTKTQTRTLGELELVKSGTRNRLETRITKFEDHCRNIARHLIAHMKAHFDVEQIAKIVPETPQEIVQAFQDKFNPQTGEIKFTKEDIQGEFDVKIQPGSTLSLDRMTRMNIEFKVADMAAKIPSPVPPFLREVLLDLLKDFDLPQLKMAFLQQEQAAQQAAQREMSMEQMEKAKTAAEAQKRLAQTDQIAAETEMTNQKASLPMDVRAMLGGGKLD